MGFLDLFRSSKKNLRTHIFFCQSGHLEWQRLENFPSTQLERPMRIDIFLPPNHYHSGADYPVLLFNDGQDMEAVQMQKHLQKGWAGKRIRPLIVVAIHAGDRMQEYGTIGRPDYQRRGRKAGAYGRFLTEELIPLLKARYRCAPASEDWGIAGFSLGGLSAFDLAWNYPQHFGKVGVFSGSFWWRSKAFREADPDADRIAHEAVARGRHRHGLRFWFQTGTNDETADRNNNGVIDAIDDTLDLIRELEKLGYQRGRDIEYVEVPGGEHHPHTWGKIMPRFLTWFAGQ